MLAKSIASTIRLVTGANGTRSGQNASGEPPGWNRMTEDAMTTLALPRASWKVAMIPTWSASTTGSSPTRTRTTPLTSSTVHADRWAAKPRRNDLIRSSISASGATSGIRPRSMEMPGVSWTSRRSTALSAVKSSGSSAAPLLQQVMPERHHRPRPDQREPPGGEQRPGPAGGTRQRDGTGERADHAESGHDRQQADEHVADERRRAEASDTDRRPRRATGLGLATPVRAEVERDPADGERQRAERRQPDGADVRAGDAETGRGHREQGRADEPEPQQRPGRLAGSLLALHRALAVPARVLVTGPLAGTPDARDDRCADVR